MRGTLESLDVDSYSTMPSPSTSRSRDGEKEKAPSFFRDSKQWIKAARHRTWALTSVQEMHIGDPRPLPLCTMAVFRHEGECAFWKRWSPGPLTLSFKFSTGDDDLDTWNIWSVDFINMLSPSVNSLKGIVIDGYAGNPKQHDDIVSRPLVEELEATIFGERVTKRMIEELEWIRTHWLAPDAAIRCHAIDENLTFPFTLLDDIVLADMATHAPSIAALASAATSVHFFTRGRSSMKTFLSFRPAIVFERAERLTVIDALVSDAMMSHAFRRVATLALPMGVATTGESMAWAVDAVGMLSQLRAIEFIQLRQEERWEGYLPKTVFFSDDSGPSFTSSVPECDSVGPCLHIQGVFSPSLCSIDFVEQTGQSDQIEGLRERIRQITLEVDLSYDVHGKPWVYCGDVAGACLAAIHNFPCLDRIVLECRVGSGEGYGWGEREEESSLYVFERLQTVQCRYTVSAGPLNGWPDIRGQLFFLALHELGWEAVELPRLGYDCRVEVRRIGAVNDPMQRKITDYFFPSISTSTRTHGEGSSA
ncbi:unnamed protein product [Vitrella brassicaformis CCMP3155]|uniref:Uncharacterized protein n=2 Tax=Vitrella brassicaformis TaxID=1169539 RepID=A0A0G4GYB4_VITBC|nr:unnamed protein product [Vitrella brassicaformis CCMP3155]|eukprot:CEM36094.1 unnamed protein product [Vitrella brassicaformis CCMP3155]